MGNRNAREPKMESTTEAKDSVGKFNPSDHYSIEYGKFTFIKKFNTKGMEHRIKFKDLEHLSPDELPHALEDILTDIIKIVGEDMEPHDKVRFHMSSDRWRRDANMPYMSVSEFTGTRVLAEMMKINQSNSGDPLCISPINLNITHTMMPNPGSGWSHNGSVNNRAYTSLEKWLAIKQCTINTINKDNLCLARSLVVAMAHYRHVYEPSDVNKEELKYIRRTDRSHQTMMAKKLHKDACVNEGPCGIQEVRQFQDHLASQDYRIYIYSAEANFQPVFVGSPTCSKRICLLLYNKHYVVITSMASFVNNSNFCWDCLKGVKSFTDHRCPRKCPCCRDVRCKSLSSQEVRMTCHACLRYFKGPDCFNLHQENGICTVIQRCEICFLQLKTGKPHICGKVKCRYCKNFVEKGHLCYIQKPSSASITVDRYTSGVNGNGKRALNENLITKRKKAKLSTNNVQQKDPIIIYFDFEAMQETGHHIPNLVVAQWEHGGNLHERIFTSETSINARDSFCKWIFEDHCGYADFKPPLLFIAHYFKGYDSYFILQYLYEHTLFPEVIFTGSKVMMINLEAQNIKFIDSFNFLPMPLEKFPSTFELKEMKKGYFPHLFNTISNQNYIGPMPPIDSYQPDSKTEEQRMKLKEWYSAEVATNKIFNMKEEIVEYCKSDVAILRDGCERFRKMLIHLFQIDPFIDTLTIASYCQKVYRSKFMPKDTIAIVPSTGYAGRTMQSAKASRWLSWVAKTTKQSIQQAQNGGEYKIGNYYVDGYSDEEKTVYEFYGCFYHGCPICYSEDTKNPFLKCTMGDAYASTLARAEYIRHKGYKLVEIWECQYEYKLKVDEMMRDFISTCNIPNPLSVREAFYGGRTSATRLHYEVKPGECIHYYDFVSLYPTVNKYGRMPLGHPSIIRSPGSYNPGEYYGFAKCRVLPPTNLYHGVLPARIHGQLLFPLCHACAECQQENCNHPDDTRPLEGTWITPELDKAISKGYKILDIHEIWHFEKTAAYKGGSVDYPYGLFGEYVNCLLKIKQEASGFPDHVTNENQKDAFIDDYFQKEGIQLTKENVKPNPGMRAIAKLMLNSLWGKFGQSENLPTTEYVTDLERFIGLLVSPEHTVTNAHIVNEEMIMVTYNKQEDFIVSSGRTNLFIAAFTTGLARLKLYELLEQLDDNVLYMDTDSVIFKSDINEDPLQHLLGDNLGKVTDEIGQGDYIEEFVSGGPKNYGYRCKSGKEVWKVCGFTQNYKTRQLINFNVIKAMVTAAENAPDEVTVMSNEIVRNKFQGNLLNKPSQKTYKINFNKGIIDENFVVYPFGFKK